MSQLREEALRYVTDLGWYVFPCKPDRKEPLTEHGVKDATINIQTVDKWWAAYPDANIAVDCGRSGIVVLDVDCKNADGYKSLSDLRERIPFDIDTVSQETPSGGMHLVYHVNGATIPNSVQKLGPGLDTKAENGYIVVAPSTVNGVPYKWSDYGAPDVKDTKPFPKELEPLLTEVAKPAPAHKIEGKILQGNRNHELASLAGTMRRRGMESPEIEAALLAVNMARCEPPLPDKEVSAIAKSIGKYEPMNPIGTAETDKEASFLPIKDILECYFRMEFGDAELLAKIASGKILYDHADKQWYIWALHNWMPDRVNYIPNLVANEVASQYFYAAAVNRQNGSDSEENKELVEGLQHRGSALRHRSRIDNVLRLAQSLPDFAIVGDEWDTDPMLLGVANGIIDLHTGELRPGKPQDFIRTVALVEWNGLDAPCPKWEKFQSEVHGGDAGVMDFMWRWRGYNITGLTDDHIFVIEWGEDGRNGKGTELEVLRYILGELTMTVNADAIMDIRDSDGNAPKPFIYNLNGKRLVWASETKDGRKLNVALIKYLTGGDTVTARKLHGMPISFRPTHKITLITNPRPRIEGGDDAAWERIRLVPYEQRFIDDPHEENEHARDAKMMEKLKEEAPGILAWLVRGCLEWQKRGLSAPDKIMLATKEYHKDENDFEQFLEAETEQGEEAYSAYYRDLRDRYETWAWKHDKKDSMMTDTKFGRCLGKKFIKDDGSPRKAHYFGVRLLNRSIGE